MTGVVQSQRKDRLGRHRERDGWYAGNNGASAACALNRQSKFSTVLVRVRFLEVLQDLVEFLAESLLGVHDLLCKILW